MPSVRRNILAASIFLPYAFWPKLDKRSPSFSLPSVRLKIHAKAYSEPAADMANSPSVGDSKKLLASYLISEPLCIKGKVVGALPLSQRKGSLMKRNEAGRSTSIKKLKHRAREIRDSQNVPLAKALEIASQAAGHESYHAALKSLAPEVLASDEHAFRDAGSAYSLLQDFVEDESLFDPMSKALADTYYGKRTAFHEFGLACLASLNPEVSIALGQWIGCALNHPELDGPTFATNVALILSAGETANRSLACFIQDSATLALKVQSALGVRGATVAFAPVAMLVRPLEDGNSLGDWLQTVRQASSIARAISAGNAQPQAHTSSPPLFGTAEGAYYVIFGRATSPIAMNGDLEAALRRCRFEHFSCVGSAAGEEFELATEELGTADMVLPWLYSEEMQFVARCAEDILRREGLTADQVRMEIKVWDGEIPRRVDVVFLLPDARGRLNRTITTPLGEHFYPTYLHLALRLAFGPVGYAVAN